MDALQRRVTLEDIVEYKLFLVQPHGTKSETTQEHLKHLADEILAKVAPLLMQYIWQHQPFNLKYHPEKGIVMHTPWRRLDLKACISFLVPPLKNDVYFVDRRCPCSHWR